MVATLLMSLAAFTLLFLWLLLTRIGIIRGGARVHELALKLNLVQIGEL